MPVIDNRFKKGLELFNQGEYYECHEVIEALWLETPKDDIYRDLYKAVIQAAAAIYQFKRGILSGAIGLYRSSLLYLSRYTPEAMGLDVDRLTRQMSLCFKQLDACDGKGVVSIDEQLIPKLFYRFESS